MDSIIFDPVLLARIQFAFTVSFHIIFPAFTIGLASFLAVLEALWLKTNNKVFQELYKFWIKIFAVAFGMGVVSGVVMAYQFGTNWSIFADKISNVIGPLLGYEVLTAFFLEATFLGVMLFGWGRVSPRMHFISTLCVAIGTLISAFWILSANSWMQTPQGYEIGPDGRFFPTSWTEIVFNPSFHYRFFHMVTGAYLTTAFVVGGVSSFYLWRKRHVPHAKVGLIMAMLMAVIVAPIQFYIGDEHGKNTMKHQPTKIAAIEGNWNETTHAPLYLFGWPNEKEQKIDYPISIPGGASFILTGDVNGEIPHLNAFKQDEHPPVVWLFWGFRIMVGICALMILIGLISAIQYFRNKLFESNWLHVFWIAMAPSGFIAILAGWFVTEIGRQPWTVYGVLRTSQSVSPALLGPQVAWSLLSFVVMYTFVFGAGTYYIIKLIRQGVKTNNESTDGLDKYKVALVENISNGE